MTHVAFKRPCQKQGFYWPKLPPFPLPQCGANRGTFFFDLSKPAWLLGSWRRKRDSNPRGQFLPACTLSRGVPSATRPFLHTRSAKRRFAILSRFFYERKPVIEINFFEPRLRLISNNRTPHIYIHRIAVATNFCLCLTSIGDFEYLLNQSPSRTFGQLSSINDSRYGNINVFR